MGSPDRFVNGFATYVERRCSKTMYVYAGYSQTSGALHIKIRNSGLRIAMRPWLRTGPVGLQDIARSNERYRIFRGQEPGAYIHVATEFRGNARRFAASATGCTLVVINPKSASIEIVGSKNLPQVVLSALIEQSTELGSKLSYDFEGTIVRDSSKGKKSKGRILRRAQNPTLFVSYSWDSDAHRRWVLKLAADLIRNGVKVLIDEWDLPSFNHDLHRFMESGVREADHVVLVCTPSYASRADARKGGVGIESTIITGEFYESATAKKFIPITRSAAGERRVLPSFLKSRFAVDFTDDESYQVSFHELLRRVFNLPRFRRPELGVAPDLSIEDV